MDKCLECNKELTHTVGRRKKKFCSTLCRTKNHRKNNNVKRVSMSPNKFKKMQEEIDYLRKLTEKEINKNFVDENNIVSITLTESIYEKEKRKFALESTEVTPKPAMSKYLQERQNKMMGK